MSVWPAAAAAAAAARAVAPCLRGWRGPGAATFRGCPEGPRAAGSPGARGLAAGPAWERWGAPRAPWTASEALGKRKGLTKRGEHIVRALEQERVQAMEAERPLPAFWPGDVLEVRVQVPENRGREMTVKGLCIGRKNRALGSSFTIRNVYKGVAYERQFPLYSPNLVDVKVLRSKKARRAKLYYLRDKALKMSRA